MLSTQRTLYTCVYVWLLFEAWWRRKIPACVVISGDLDALVMAVMTYVWRQRLLQSRETALFIRSGKVQASFWPWLLTFWYRIHWTYWSAQFQFKVTIALDDAFYCEHCDDCVQLLILLIDCDISLSITFAKSSTRGNRLKLVKPSCRCDVRKYL